MSVDISRMIILMGPTMLTVSQNLYLTAIMVGKEWTHAYTAVEVWEAEKSFTDHLKSYSIW